MPVPVSIVLPTTKPKPRPRTVRTRNEPSAPRKRQPVAIAGRKRVARSRTIARAKRKPAAKPAAKSPRQPRRRTSPHLMPPVDRKTAVAKARAFVGRKCLCGCGTLVPLFFVRGHITRWNAGIRAIARGADRNDVFDKKTVADLGPWKKNSRGGYDPTGNYADCR